MSTAGDDAQDLTRKQRREQARAQRRELEQAQAASAARRTRLIQLGVVAAVVVAVIVGIVIATSGGKSSHVASTPQAKNKVASEVNSLLGGIPQSGSVLGNPNAPVTLVFFGDLQCPICRDFSLGVLPGLVQNYVRAGKLRIEYRSLETATREPETFRKQQIAALAGGSQSKMWYYTELFYHQQGEEDTGYVTESYLHELARQVPGLNLNAWEAARSDAALASSVTTDAQAANNSGFTGTPSFLIGKTGGQLHKFEEGSLTDPSGFVAVIEKARKS